MYLINKFEKDILENSLNKMNNKQSNSNTVLKPTQQTQTETIVGVNPGDITLKKDDEKENSVNSGEISVLTETRQPLNRYHNSQSANESSPQDNVRDVSSK